jgi:hypothetical protein
MPRARREPPVDAVENRFQWVVRRAIYDADRHMEGLLTPPRHVHREPRASDQIFHALDPFQEPMVGRSVGL